VDTTQQHKPEKSSVQEHLLVNPPPLLLHLPPLHLSHLPLK
jgi:hypothetical protein